MTAKNKQHRPIKRSLTISGHRTSVSLENEFWEGLREIADLEGKSINQIVRAIDAARGDANLSSAIRIEVLKHYKAQITAEARWNRETLPN